MSSYHDYFLITSVVVPIFFFGVLLNQGKLKGHGHWLANTIALGIVTWSMMSAHDYYGIVNYVFH